MHVYNFNSNKPISTYSGFNSDVTWVNFTYDESKVLAGTFGGTLFVYNYDRGKVVNTFRGHLTHCRWAIGQKDDLGNYVVSGSSDTNVKVWDMRQKSAIATYKGHTKAISDVDMSPDTQYVASGCTGGLVKLWDLTAGKLLNTIDIKTISSSDNLFIKSIKFNPADWWMAVAWSDKVIRYYDTTSFELINESLSDAHPISNIDFDPDGETVITAYSDAIKVWDLETRKLVSYVSKGARPTFDLKWAYETDFTFILENVSGTLGLSSLSTSWLLKKNSNLEDYEEEKRPKSSNNENNGGSLNDAIFRISDDVLKNIPGFDKEKPLDFYQIEESKNSKPLIGKVINNSEHDYVYGLEDSNDLDNYTPENGDKPQFSNLPNGAHKGLQKKSNKQKNSRIKVFWNNGKNMIQMPEEKKKSAFGSQASKPSLGSKVVLEGKAINGLVENPKKAVSNNNVAKGGISLLTEEGLKNFEKQYNGDRNEIATIRSEWTASLYEVPIDKPWGLNLEKFLNNVGHGITQTQTFGTIGHIPSAEVQRKIIDDVIKSHKTMLSVMNSRKIHLNDVKSNWEIGDLSKTLNSLVINKDTSAVMDFINNSFVSNSENEQLIKSNLDSIKLTNWAALLSHIYTLLNSKYETYLIWGVKALKLIFQRISEIIFKAADELKHADTSSSDMTSAEK